ncbi:cell wall-binding repeat-containing protein [Kineococcus rubinsiae]|uniref:cell wall-binding repeat-containing protein n=1 Tax=Kineococcus rubinsiae TaxID=2609562 RepID=UPI0014320B9D|nr:cell wall-binding repeat-containing protein [Kineococcus rubinsiae]
MPAARRLAAPLLAGPVLAGLTALALASPAAAADREVLTPVCVPALPVVHPGCAVGRTYAGAEVPDPANYLTELRGTDRWGTAALIAEAGFPQADVAVLVSGDDGHLVDALSAGPLARTLAAPVLLAGVDRIPAATAEFLTRHAVKAVLVVGGPTSLDAGTEARLRALGVTSLGRVAGEDRYATSRAVAALLPPTAHAWVAAGSDAHRVDALSAGGPAAGLREPVYLVAGGAVATATAAALSAAGTTSTSVVGGPGAVADDVLAQLPGAQRVAGTDRFGTAAAAALDGVGRGLPGGDVVIAPGGDDHLVDALAAAPLGRPTLLLVDTQASYDVIEAWWSLNGATRTTAVGPVRLSG